MDDTHSTTPLQPSPGDTLATSHLTTDSAFADSAVDVKTREGSETQDLSDDWARKLEVQARAGSQSPETIPLPPDYTEEQAQRIEAQSLSPIAGTLSDRLRQLAATAWTLEQGEGITFVQRQQVNTILHKLTGVLDEEYTGGQPGGEGPQIESEHDHNEDGDDDEEYEEDEEEEYINESDLHHIYDSLQKTVQSMRDRREEQKHLYELTVSKLEGVAQQCIAQEQQIADLVRSVQDLKTQNQTLHVERDSLRSENRVLGTENDDLRSGNEELRHRLVHLHSEAQKKANALSAMGSAVAGLEGWIDSNGNGHSNNNHNNNNNNSNSNNNTLHPHKSDRIYPNSAPRLRQQQQKPAPPSTPTHKPSKQQSSKKPNAVTRTIVRGTGRFRGRYQVDVDDWGDDQQQQQQQPFPPSSSSSLLPHHQPHQQDIHDFQNFNGYDNDHDPQNFIDSRDGGGGVGGGVVIVADSGTTAAADLQDDVRAWIRGCRDVLEYVGADTEIDPLVDVPQPKRDGLIRRESAKVAQVDGVVNNAGHDHGHGDDEWGDFQDPQRVQ